MSSDNRSSISTASIAPTSSSSTLGIWTDVPRRMATICLGVPCIWLLWCHSVTTRNLFFQGVHLFMCWEWVVLTNYPRSTRFIFIIVSLGLVNGCNNNSLFLSLLVVSAACLSLVHYENPQIMLASMTGFIFLTIPCRSWLSISQDFTHTVSLLLTVWNGDTGALIAGRVAKSCCTMGIHRPWPRPQWLQKVSPAKSVEGLFGVFCFGTATYLSLPTFWKWIHYWNLAPQESQTSTLDMTDLNVLPFFHRLVVGMILSLAALLGDLFESSLKRTFNVKDSGRLLPGHGGVLDRFDSSLIAVLFFEYYLRDR